MVWIYSHEGLYIEYTQSTGARATGDPGISLTCNFPTRAAHSKPGQPVMQGFK